MNQSKRFLFCVLAMTLVVCSSCARGTGETSAPTPEEPAPNAIQARVVPETEIPESETPETEVPEIDDSLLQGVDAELLGDVSRIKHATLPSGVQPENPVELRESSDAEVEKALNAKARGSARQHKAAVELLWRIPEQDVEHYVLSYGSSPDELYHRVIIPMQKLETASHPSFGSVYRYVLHQVPMNSALYFTLQAANDTGLSAEAPVQKLEIK